MLRTGVACNISDMKKESPSLIRAFSRMRLLLLLPLLVLMNSCNKYTLFTTNQPVTNATGSSDQSESQAVYEKPLAVDDKVTISVWEHDDISIGSVHGIYSMMEENGKWLSIDQFGEVKLPQVGNVKLAGLTIREATLYLEKTYSKYIQNPIINLRVLNNQVTILGEVRRPGNYSFSSDNIRLVDIVGKAEGFTEWAKTTEIKIIRGADKPSEYQLDYTNISSLAGKGGYLRPGDVIYVPPTKAKSADKIINKMIPIASFITAIVLVFTVVGE